MSGEAWTPRFRARIFSDVTVAAERCWMYEVYDTSRPVGYQIIVAGVRGSWRECLGRVLKCLFQQYGKVA